jgi:GNAT superfamily N-acetyltransferase
MINKLPKKHFIFSVERPLYEVKASSVPSTKEVVKHLNSIGEDSQIIHGTYGGNPETSIMISNPKNVSGLMGIAHALGQESVINSVNGKHELHYINGPNSGQIVNGEGTKFFHANPDSDHSKIITPEGELYFSHNLNFDNVNKSETKRYLEDEDFFEDLNKAPIKMAPMDTKVMHEPDQLTIRVKRTELPNGLIYEQHAPKTARQDSEGLRWHDLLDPRDNTRLATLETRHMPEATHSVTWGEVNPEYRGHGLGRQLYLAAALHLKHLHSDDALTPKAHKMWQSFKDNKGFDVNLAPYGKESLGRHHMAVSDPSKVEYNKIFSKIDLAKNDDLEKGIYGDWKKEGYQIRHAMEDSPVFTGTRIYATDKNNKEIGFARIIPFKNHIESQDTYIHEEHQRKGLASAMYQHAEEIFKKPIKPSSPRTIQGKKLWSQPNRLFGKSEELLTNPPRGNLEGNIRNKEDNINLKRLLEEPEEVLLEVPESDVIKNITHRWK